MAGAGGIKSCPGVDERNRFAAFAAEAFDIAFGEGSGPTSVQKMPARGAELFGHVLDLLPPRIGAHGPAKLPQRMRPNNHLMLDRLIRMLRMIHIHRMLR